MERREARPRVMGAQALSQKRLGVPVLGTSRVRIMHPSACRRSPPLDQGGARVSKPGRETRRGNEGGCTQWQERSERQAAGAG